MRAAISAVVLLLAFVLGCNSSGGGNSMTGPIGPPRDPNNNWNVEGDPAHSFNLVCDTCPAVSAPLDGEEFLNGGVNPLAGSFAGDSIEFTVARPAGDVLYEGMFIDDDTIVVSSSTETLTLIRDLG